MRDQTMELLIGQNWKDSAPRMIDKDYEIRWAHDLSEHNGFASEATTLTRQYGYTWGSWDYWSDDDDYTDTIFIVRRNRVVGALQFSIELTMTTSFWAKGLRPEYQKKLCIDAAVSSAWNPIGLVGMFKLVLATLSTPGNSILLEAYCTKANNGSMNVIKKFYTEYPELLQVIKEDTTDEDDYIHFVARVSTDPDRVFQSPVHMPPHCMVDLDDYDLAELS